MEEVKSINAFWLSGISGLTSNFKHLILTSNMVVLALLYIRRNVNFRDFIDP
jgi:hypothetical protein